MSNSTKPKNHHYVPATYLKSWCFNSNTLYQFNKDNIKTPSNIQGRNIYKIFRRSKLYAFTINDIYILNYKLLINGSGNLNEIFNPLENCKVILSGHELKTEKDFLFNYEEIASWDIFDNQGKRISNKDIKSKIDRNFIVELENLLDSETENRWTLFLEIISKKINGTGCYTKREFDKEYLSKLITLMINRNPKEYVEHQKLFNTLVGHLFSELKSNSDTTDHERIENEKENMMRNMWLKVTCSPKSIPYQKLVWMI